MTTPPFPEYIKIALLRKKTETTTISKNKLDFLITSRDGSAPTAPIIQIPATILETYSKEPNNKNTQGANIYVFKNF